MSDTPKPLRHADASTIRPSNEAAWMEQLLELNPWARGLDVDDFDQEFTQHRKRASFDRWRTSATAWQNWAAGMNLLKPAKGAALRQRWKAIATVDFSEYVVEGADHFQFGLTFPSDAYFNNTDFAGRAEFRNGRFAGRVEFNDARFQGLADFSGSRFRAQAFFSRARFKRFACFQSCRFGGYTSFDSGIFNRDGGTFGNAAFENQASFRSVRFLGLVEFDSTTFEHNACFSGSHFTESANFNGARFAETADFGTGLLQAASPDTTIFDGAANFCGCDFSGAARWDGAIFNAQADFATSKAERTLSFASASFATTPDLTEMDLPPAVRLDHFTLASPICERPIEWDDDPRPPGLFRLFALARDEHEHARLRTLRKLAGDAKDHENELKFNGWEIAARRFWVDHPWRHPGRFWLGWLYGVVSDYGQSILRPIVGWAATVAIFWSLYFFTTLDLPQLSYGDKCHPTYADTTRITDPVTQSFALSLRNSTIIDRSEPATARRMYGCLYGLQVNNSQRADPPPAALPVIPTSVVFISTVQTVISAIFLFLAGLGLRNMFRMK